MFLAQTVGFLDTVLVIVYLGICAYLGWLGYRHTHNAADYLLAGRKTHPFIMAMSYGATFISTSAIVGFGGVAGLFGMSLLWLTFMNIAVGIFIAFVFLGGPTRRIGHRLDAHTFPEFLGRRYESKAIQVIAGLVIFCFMPLYAAAVLIGGCEFLASAFGLNYDVALLVFAVLTAAYVFWGGLKGVLYTDAFQGTIMTIGMLILLVAAYAHVGGVVQGHHDLAAMKDQAFVGFKAIGHQGWTAMPRFGFGWGGVDPASGKPSPYDLWWIVVTTIVMGVGIGVLAQPQLVVRFLTVKSGKELNRALVYGGIFILLMTGVAFTVGALSNVYFYKYEKITGTLLSTTEQTSVIAKKEPGEDKRVPCRLLHLDTDGDGNADTHIVAQGVGKAEAIMPKAVVTQLPDGRVEVQPRATAFTRAVVYDAKEKAWMFNSDSIIPTYITSAMPQWFKVVFLLTLLSAAMSTMSSQYHTLGTAIGHDVIGQVVPARDAQARARRSIHVVRLGIIVGLVLAVVLGYYTRGGYIIARATAVFFGLCASAFLPAFVGGLFFKRMTRAAAIASMIVGLVVTLAWVALVKTPEAGSIGLVQKLTGGEISLLKHAPNWPRVDPLLIALPCSVFTALIVSLFTQPPRKEHLARCFD